MATGRQIGGSQLEVVLVTVLILALITTLLRELYVFYEGSEKIQVEATLERLSSAVNSLSTEHMVTGDLSGLARYAGSNPMQLLPNERYNYKGVISSGEGHLQSARWYFNRSQQQLIYLLADPSEVKQQGGVAGQLSFKLNLKYRDYNQNQRYDRGTDVVLGLALQPVYPYQWLEP